MTTREVILDGGSPWGFRMHGGADVQQPLRISRVNPGSKASLKGVREGDLITSINGQPTKDITNSEAHALLKSAGDKLKLGLNEDCTGSPKRRQYKTVLQESHSETVKRSSISSSTKYTISSSTTNDLSSSPSSEISPTIERTNGIPRRESAESKDNGIISQRSTLSSNDSTASTPSTSSKGAVKTAESAGRNTVNTQSENCNVMADNVIGNSRSKKRRRSNRKKSKKSKTAEDSSQLSARAESVRECDNEIPNETTTKNNYRVESPITARKRVAKQENGTGTVVKSKSLDGDEMLRITEIDSCEGEDKNVECNAVVAEADSDVEWEVTCELKTGAPAETPNISPEEESNLRTFLEGIDLVTSAQAAARVVYEKTSLENVKTKRTKKRDQLVQYFTPVYQNPRFLDVISEEGSDLSDREQKDAHKTIIKQPQFALREDQQETPLLVGIKILDNPISQIENEAALKEQDGTIFPIIQQGLCSSGVVAESSNAELVHLDDLSDSDITEESAAGNSEGESTDVDVNSNIDVANTSVVEAVSCDEHTCGENITGSVPPSELTPPPTPESATPENERACEMDAPPPVTGDVIETPLISIKNKIKTESVNEQAFEREFKELFIQQENVAAPNVKNNSAPSRSSSSSSDSSDSVGTTQCTALYNPMASSAGDVNAILKDVENIKDYSKSFQPATLKEICLKRLVALPFGPDVLEELAEVSQSLEEFTNKLPKTQFHIPHNKPSAAFINQDASVETETNACFTIPVHVSEEKWVGFPTEIDPHSLICLSPTQKEFLDTNPRLGANEILDLHQKFINRRTFQEQFSERIEKECVIITSTHNKRKDDDNRLLDIIRLEHDEIGNVLCGGNITERAKSATLPRIKEAEALNNDARLKARGLSEWLQLARNNRGLSIHADAKTKRAATTNNTEQAKPTPKRRRSLPHELYVRQMQYLIEKEKEIQQELERLEGEKRKLTTNMYTAVPVPLQTEYFTKNEDVEKYCERPKSMDSTERFRQQMYDEYMTQVAAREERKQHKVIKISLHNEDTIEEKQSENKNEIEHEFMDKVKQRMDKFGLHRDGSREKPDPQDEKKAVLIMDGDSITQSKKLPKHLQEFIDIAQEDGVWSPGQKQSFNPEELKLEVSEESLKEKNEDNIPPVWTPRSAGSSPTAERKEFRPVNFESPVLGRKTRTKSDGSAHLSLAEPPWKPSANSETVLTSVEKRLPTSYSAPGPGFSDIPATSRLPKAQNPTITLLQKAREGQIPKGAAYIEQERHRRKNESPYSSSDLVYQLRTESMSDSDSERPRKIVHISPKKYEGIGPTTKDGMPLVLRSEIRDANMSQWYKKMYDTIHKQKPSRYNDDEYVMVRYKQRRGRYPYATGYLSEPEPGAYDSDATLSDNKFATLDRRRPTSNKENEYNMSSTLPRNAMSTTTINYKTSDVQHIPESYKNQPGRIENYTPGQSSISDKEAKKWWDEVMDIFDGHLEQQKRVPQTKGYMSQALKESGYESDSTLVFRRRDDTAQQLSPLEQREVYKNIQKGGDVPLHGLRKPAPERPKEETHVEYFPISPTLNRIRVHKSAKPRRDFFTYPVNVPPHPPQVFATYKRSAPSTLASNLPRKPPSPPRRKSSRNNSTLRLISTMKIRPDKGTCKRHETCFASTSAQDKSNVKYLRDKITCKLSPQGVRRETRLKLSKAAASTIEKPKGVASAVRTKPIAASLPTRRCCNKQIKPCRSCSLSAPRKHEQTVIKERPVSLDRTFGAVKKSIDVQPPRRVKTLRTSELKSPTEVKKAVINQINTLNGSSPKASSTILSTVKNKSAKTTKMDKSKSVSKDALIKTSRMRTAASPVPSILSRSSKSTSMDSLKSSIKSLPINKPKIVKPVQSKDKKLKKSKKDQLNVELVKETKKSKLQKKDEQQKLTPPKITVEEISKQKDIVQTDSFFQHLFLRNMPSSPKQPHSWMHEKTLALKNVYKPEPSFGALSIYLNHTKPVTDSKFKSLDMTRSRSVSPKTVTWKKNDDNIYYSDRERSISLPPKLTFTPPSRPATPVMGRKSLKIYPKSEDVFTRLINGRSRTPSPASSERLYFSETSRPVSPLVFKRVEPVEIIRRKGPEKIIFTETSRPVSPIVEKRSTFSPTPSSPKVIRSPSCRKIKSRQGVDSKKRALSVGECGRSYFVPEELYHSTSSLESFDSITFRTSNRFRDLSKFYTDVERFGQLEKTTSTSDLRPRKRHEEDIIDFDRWKEVRMRERAEREMRDLYKELREKEKEKNFLFRTKDVNAYRWKRDMDRGLRIKEKSVENIKEEFEKMRRDELEKEALLKEELIYKRGVYKPLWRGNSVVNLAHTLNERRSQSEGRVSSARQKIIDSEKLLTHGIGSRIWSSLSMEQVNILKNQLSEIYGNDSKFQKTVLSKPNTDCTIDVALDRDMPPVTLKVRRNSDSPKTSPLMNRRTDKMSEDDKMKFSQSLSKEVLERQRKKYKTSLSLVLGKETRGAIAAADANVNTEMPSPRTCYSLEMSEDDKDHASKENDFVLVLTKNDSDAHKNDVNETLEIWAQPKKALVKTDAVSSKPTSISEAESGSTDGSIKTVISANGSKEKILEKVEYFENISDRDVYTPTIYKPADNGYDVGDTIVINPPKEEKLTRYMSQSQQDLKELFGEEDLKKFASEPLSASRIRNYSPQNFPKLRSSHIYRSRSLSPHYDDSYASLKAGDVSRLKNKFEYKDGFYSHRYGLKPRRCNSDPQLNKKIHIPGQRNGDVDNLRLKFEYPIRAGRGRSRYRRGGIVSPIFLRAEDRFMPHINIISKIASLYPRKSASPSPDNLRSSEDLANILGIPVGEVEKLRQRFDSPEKMSILGHMFTSSPNIHELRDVAQYLTGSWTAHRYPKSEDNTRPLSPIAPKMPRPKSASPVRPKTKLSSILKTNQRRNDPHSKHFDPTIHRPVARYQPPPPKSEPVKYRSRWSPAPAHTRPSVTFKEPEGPPPPPPKGTYDLTDSNSESPRKYVENEVTIHYRTPVRQEVKEALSEDELAKRQADAMRKIYEEERRRKYLQVSHSDNELHDMNSRRHTDNFIPSQKSPIPLNRYDDFLDDLSPRIKPRPRSPEPRLVARALYNFVGQTARELTFKRGDVIYIRRQVDKNWYEGEINAMVGLFPANYVEIVPYDGIKSTPRKAHEGQARAKYNFIAQTHLELSLAKGELVVITRRVDDNWFEGKIGGRKGIFPVSYVEVLVDPSEAPAASTPSSKPVASPAAHSLLLNGSAGGKDSMGTHNYVPTFPTQDLGMSYRARPIQISGGSTYGSLKKNPVDQALHIDTQSEPIPYRALYKYRPQNEDELELLEGDTVFVLEKCDDGWYVGSSDRTGAFGTFPGNYVERI